MIYRVVTKEWPPCSIRIRAFFDFNYNLWDIIAPYRPILVETRLQKSWFRVGPYSKRVEKFKKHFYCNPIGGAILLYPPFNGISQLYRKGGKFKLLILIWY